MVALVAWTVWGGAGVLVGQARIDRSQVVIDLWADLPTGDSASAVVPTEAASDAAHAALIAEAEYVLTGMVYGFDFSYSPGQVARGQAEFFEIVPVRQVVRSYPGFSVRSTRQHDERVYAQIVFQVPAGLDRWIEAWQGSDSAGATGLGWASWYAGPTAKLDAIADAVRDAVRRRVRTLSADRPYRAEGMVLFDDAPQLAVVDARYRCTVSLRIRVRRIEPYAAF